MRIRGHRRGVVAVLAAGAAVLCGGAAAFWLVLGNGSAGSQAGTVSVVNGNPGRIVVGSLLLDTGQGTNGFSVDGGHSGCNLAALGYTTQTNGGAGWSVAGSSTLPLDLSGAVSLSTSAVSACQGAQVTVYLQAGP
jgi:hypothetical protein